MKKLPHIHYAIFILVLFAAVTKIGYAQPNEKHHILILHSYHQGYEWTDDVNQGIMAHLMDMKDNIIYVEYLDCLRNSSGKYLDMMESLFREKYLAKNIRFDLIIASDDNALQFLRNRKDLIQDVPIVFLGINDFDPENFTGLTNYTGINEQISVEETVEVALQLRPKAKKIAVIAGSSLTAQRNLHIFQEKAKNFENRIEIRYFDELEHEELKKRLENFDQEDIIIYLSYLSTPSGKIFTVEESIELIKSYSDAAIFSFWDFLLPYGLVGGKVVHGNSQGEFAAEIANRILKGTLPGEIPVQMESPNKFVFNDKLLHYYNIPHDSLPAKSIIINRSGKSLIDDWDEITKNSFFSYEMFENHGSLMWLIDPDTGMILDANKAALNYYGYSNLVGMNISDINPLSRAEMQEEMNRAKEEEQNFFPFKHRLADNRVIDVEVFSYPVEIGDKKVLFSIMHDVTEKLQAEKALKEKNWVIFLIVLLALLIQSGLVFFLFKNIKNQKKTGEALRQSEEKYRILTEFASDVIWTFNLTRGVFTYISPSIYQLRGYTAEEAMGQSLEESLTPESYEVVRDKFSTKMESIQTSNDENESFISEIQQPCKNGAIIWVEVSTKFRYNAEKEIEIIGVSRNIEQRKRTEEEILYLSYRDQLTGLYNRRFYEEELKRLDTERNLPITLVMADINGLKLANDAFGHLVGDKLLQKAAEIIVKECRSDDVIARIGGDEFVILLPNTGFNEGESLAKRIKEASFGKKVESIDLSISFGVAAKIEIRESMKDIFKQAEDFMYQRKLYESPSMRGNTIKTIIQTMHEKLPGEKEHSDRVSPICQEIGKELGMSLDEIAEIATVGLMHDIGKISIKEDILHKLGKLNEVEWLEIRRHPETGYRILSSVNEMAQLAEYTLAHHENWDGSGYPRGLKGEEIPLQARIIRIADAYDAMTSTRSYKNSLTKEEAIEEIRKNAGRQFDPYIANIFIKLKTGEG